MRFLFVGNSTYMNHGSEAIVRGTVNILRKYFDCPEFISSEVEVFPYSKICESDPGIVHQPLFMPKPYTLQWFFNQTRKALLTRPFAYRYYTKRLLPEIRKATAVLSLGGDNYGGQPFLHIAVNDWALKVGTPAILWGASIGTPFTGSERYKKSAFNHLRKLTAIFVREEVSQQYLTDNGVIDNVYRVEDPAFAMQPEEPDNPEFVEKFPSGAIGVSLSRLFLKRTRYSENCEAGVYEIVEAIRRRFRRPIVLVPHCVADYNDDHFLLNSVLKENYSNWPDVTCLPKMMPAAQIKWAISKLHVLITARMHAAIAAFSTYVPTVSLAYSFKSIGFNQKLFDCLDYVITKEECTPERIVEKTILVMNNHSLIQSNLKEKMEQVINGAMRAGEILKKILCG